MFSFIAAARESNIDLHLECERQFLNLAHTFDHINYTRWCTFQHVNLSEMKRQSTEAYQDLKNGGFTASQKGGVFDAVPGDYICERQNSDTKSAEGPIKSGLGTNISNFNNWIRTRHVAVDMQNMLRKILHIKTSSIHKNSTSGGIQRHTSNVGKLKDITRSTYKYDFFAKGPVRAITTGKQVDENVVCDLLSSAEKGCQCYKDFVRQRLVSKQLSIFASIRKNKLKTGITKPQKTPKPVEVLKEDVQGFGILADHKTTLKEAFKYPITTLPLSIAESATDLRGATSSSKSKFRNHILKTINSISYVCPKSAVWIYDAAKFIRCQPPERTYQQFFDKILERMIPPKNVYSLSVHIVLDKYVNNSTKSGARQMRGEINSTRLFITGLGQFMPSTIDEWKSALSNNQTKQNLFSLFTRYVLSGKPNLLYQTIINDEDETWMLDPKENSVTNMFTCNHEEANTRGIYHASRQGESNVVISANDSDVLFLGTYACALDAKRKWHFNYQSNTFADLQKFAESLGSAAMHLPTFHSLTGCDTTSYFYFRGKTAPWERAIKSTLSFELIEDLGNKRKLSEEALGNCVEFVRCFVYGGKNGEDLVDTKVRMYRAIKEKN